MKTPPLLRLAIFLGMLAALSHQNLAAQETIGFANSSTSALTNGLTGLRLPVGGDFRVALFYGPPAVPDVALVQIAGPIGITGADGRFNGGAVAVPGWSPGAIAQFQVRAWDSRGGTVTSYAAATADATVLTGKSVPVLATPGSTLVSAGLKGFPLYSSQCLSITCPSNVMAMANCTGSAPVNFTIIASNQCAGGGLTVSCSQSNGASFTNGTTTLVICDASDNFGHSVSCSFNVSVLSPTPVFTVLPQSRVTTNGGSVTFNANATGPPPLSYQWSFNGTDTGSNRATYAVSSAQSTNEGTYTVTVTSACGYSNKTAATLTVLKPTASGALVPSGTFWKYQFTDTEPAATWRTLTFNDGSWPGGRAQLGFGDGDEATVIGIASNQFITAYFRRLFLAPTNAAATNLFLALRRDDGAVVYLNNVELFRSNLPTGAVDHTTLALQFDPFDGTNFTTFVVPPNRLLPGTNVLAAEVHQYDPLSTDLSFDLQLLALTTSRPQVQLTRSLTNVTVNWPNAGLRLESAAALNGTNTVWTATPSSNSPASFPFTGPRRYFRLVWP